MSPKKNLISFIVLTALVGCTKLGRGRSTEDDAALIPEKPVAQQTLDAQKSTLGILSIAAELRSDGLLLHISNIPAGAQLECDLDNKPLVPCHDLALFTLPTEGSHKLSAIALKDGHPIAFGESAPFTVLPGAGSAYEKDGDPRSNLTLLVDDSAFSNGMTLPLSQDFKARFKFIAAPDCKAELRCKYDSRTSQFWTECDAGDASFTISKDLLALGLQYFSVQATCGDRHGPTLTMSWYGVPDGYQPLLLKDVRDPKGRHIVELVRDEDCPEGQPRKFECAAKDATEFDQCVESNTFDNPAAGTRVRLKCAETAGPELVFAP